MDFKKDIGGFRQMAIKLGIILPYQSAAVKLDILDATKLAEVVKDPASVLKKGCACGQCGDAAQFVVLQIDGAIISRFQAAALLGLFEAGEPPASIEDLMDAMQPVSNTMH